MARRRSRHADGRVDDRRASSCGAPRARAGRVERAVGRATRPVRNVGFPYRPPTVPRGVEVPEEPPTLGADYDTDWARNPGRPRRPWRDRRGTDAAGRARAAPTRRCSAPTASTTCAAGRRRRRPPPPLIFAPNHHSHLDTALMIRAVPFSRGARKLVVAAAADYFFDKRWKATLVGAVAERHPDRPRVDRAAGRPT